MKQHKSWKRRMGTRWKVGSKLFKLNYLFLILLYSNYKIKHQVSFFIILFCY